IHTDAFIRDAESIALDISGTVMDNEGNPLIGVNIRVKGTDFGTATDADGAFYLEDVDEEAILVFSYIGYQTKEVSVAGNTSHTVTLLSDSQLLDEVVVVGYGTQTKRDLTGSVAQISNKELESVP